MISKWTAYHWECENVNGTWIPSNMYADLEERKHELGRDGFDESGNTPQRFDISGTVCSVFYFGKLRLNPVIHSFDQHVPIFNETTWPSPGSEEYLGSADMNS